MVVNGECNNEDVVDKVVTIVNPYLKRILVMLCNNQNLNQHQKQPQWDRKASAVSTWAIDVVCGTLQPVRGRKRANNKQHAQGSEHLILSWIVLFAGLGTTEGRCLIVVITTSVG